MQVTIFTHTEDVYRFQQIMASLSQKRVPLDYKIYETYDAFITGFSAEAGQAVIVARRGAEGMESARNARLIHEDVPLVWFSDDGGFGIESYRIGCAFFSAEAITEALLLDALSRCEKLFA